MPSIRVEQPIPFAPAALHAANARRWRGFYERERAGGALPPARAPPSVRLYAEPAYAPALATGAGECDRLVKDDDRILRLLRYESSPQARAWRYAQWFLLFLMIAFIAIVVGLMTHVFSQMQAIYDEVTSAESGGTLTSMMEDAAHATASMSAASTHVLEMARTAHATLDSSVPVVTGALNKSAGMVEQLSSFSAHPQLTIGAG
jgi:hypothetical protein